MNDLVPGGVSCTVGRRQALVGNDARVVAVIEIIRVQTHGLCDVPYECADAQGEGFGQSSSGARDRSSHPQQGIDVDDNPPFACIRVRLIDTRRSP